MTFGRMEPGSSAWSAAHDRHLSPPEYDGCEDCTCEDPEHPEPAECGLGLRTRDPITGIEYEELECECAKCAPELEPVLCTCDCHTGPHYDPREDGDEPDDIPDYWDDRDIYDGGF